MGRISQNGTELPSPDEAVRIAYNSKYADLKNPKEAAEAVDCAKPS
jgi:hypothetical protein